MELGRRAMLTLLLISALSHTATAANYTVGGSGGWTFQTSNSAFYDDEFTGVTLVVGDVLLFTYDSADHDVYEVSQSDLTACSTANPITRYAQSNAAVTLSTAGYHGFICGFSGHCGLGMHLQVTVSAAASTPTPTTASPAVAPSPVPVSPPTSTPAPSTPAATPSSSVPTPSVAPTPPSISTPPATTSPTSAAEAPSPITPGSGAPLKGVPSLPAVIVGTLMAGLAVLLQ